MSEATAATAAAARGACGPSRCPKSPSKPSTCVYVASFQALVSRTGIHSCLSTLASKQSGESCILRSNKSASWTGSTAIVCCSAKLENA